MLYVAICLHKRCQCYSEMLSQNGWGQTTIYINVGKMINSTYARIHVHANTHHTFDCTSTPHLLPPPRS